MYIPQWELQGFKHLAGVHQIIRRDQLKWKYVNCWHGIVYTTCEIAVLPLHSWAHWIPPCLWLCWTCSTHLPMSSYRQLPGKRDVVSQTHFCVWHIHTNTGYCRTSLSGCGNAASTVSEIVRPVKLHLVPVWVCMFQSICFLSQFTLVCPRWEVSLTSGTWIVSLVVCYHTGNAS